MSDDKKPKLSPEQGSKAVMDLIPGILQKTKDEDLGGLDGILDQLGGIAAAAGLDMADIGARLDGVKEQSAKAQRHFENTDAALWAGDMPRVHLLNQTGPALDHDALGVPVSSYDAFDEPKENDPEEIAAALAEMGIDPAVMVTGDDIIPDRYAEIAAGTVGAVTAFIATGQDPNLPTGDGQHTALLAALDAPRRNVGDLQALIDAGADPVARHAYGDTALSWAMGYRHLNTVTADSEAKVIALLVGHGIDINHAMPDFGSPFRRALIEGDENQVAAMLALGADPHPDLPMEFPTHFLAGATPIMAAAPKPKVIKLLLTHGVDPTKPDANGRVPVDFIRDHSIAAQARADAADPWTGAHARALNDTLSLLTNAV